MVICYNTRAIGCIFGELLKSKPLLPGQHELEQFGLIARLLGSPHVSIWPDLKEMPLYDTFDFSQHKYDSVREEFADFSKMTQDLVKSFLIYCPEKRIAAHQALKHEFFYESPKACSPTLLAEQLSHLK